MPICTYRWLITTPQGDQFFFFLRQDASGHVTSHVPWGYEGNEQASVLVARIASSENFRVPWPRSRGHAFITVPHAHASVSMGPCIVTRKSSVDKLIVVFQSSMAGCHGLTCDVFVLLRARGREERSIPNGACVEKG